jgi:hypothetical protein
MLGCIDDRNRARGTQYSATQESPGPQANRLSGNVRLFRQGIRTISKIERGQIAIEVNGVARIARALEVDLLELFQGKALAETDTSHQGDVQPPVTRRPRVFVAFNQLENDLVLLCQRHAEALRQGPAEGDVQPPVSPERLACVTDPYIKISGLAPANQPLRRRG